MRETKLALGCLLLLAAACAPRPTAAPTAPGRRVNDLPPVPERRGTLAIDLVYPGEGQALGVRDSTFLFGSVGTGGATLTVNGAPVEVAPNGAFLAFLPVPPDGRYRLSAAAEGRTVEAVRQVRVPAAPSAGAGAGGGRLTVVQGSVQPRGTLMVVEGEPVEVRLRGTPGAAARLVLPGGEVVPLVERGATERDEGFMLSRVSEARGVSEYQGVFAARRLAAGDSAGRRGAHVELTGGGDTVRVPLELTLRTVARGAPRVAVAASARPDRMVIGTAVPGSGTPYHWFFGNGTRFNVDGARAGQLRVRLTDDLSVWVDSSEVRLLPVGTPAVRGTVGTVRAVHAPEHIDVRLSLSERLPVHVEPGDRGVVVNVYGAESRTNWVQYGATEPGIRRLEWEQPGDDLYRLHVELEGPLWGFRTLWTEGGDLVVRLRRPPVLDPRDPLRGLYLAVDAGHPPGGAIGPTRLTEAEANLAISRRLVAMLRERGARVLETRPDTAAVALGARPQEATDSSVHLLVSVHNNAFPDGVNPFENNGTSVFYNPAHSLELARALQRELLAELGLRDLGIARADLALVRPTWMPSALTETMFLMVPQQEAALRDPGVQERIARAHLRGIEAFLRQRLAGRP